jgi:outer membrane protein
VRALSFVIIASALGSTRDAAAEERRVTLQECLELALEVNPSVHAGKIEMLQAEQSVRAARGAFFPELKASLSFSRTANATPYTYYSQDGLYSDTVFGYQAGLGGLLPTGTLYSLDLESEVSWTDMTSILFNETHVNSLSLKLTQPLLRGWGWKTTLSKLEGAREDYLAAQRELDNQALVLVGHVVQAYWELRYALEYVQIAKRSVELAEGLLKSIDARVHAGTLSPLDLIEAQAAIAARRETLVQSQQDAKSAETELIGYLYSESRHGKAIDLNGGLTPSDVPEALPEMRALEALVSLALRQRPDVKTALHQLNSQGIASAAADNGRLPKLDIAVKAGLASLAGHNRCETSDPDCTPPAPFMVGDHLTAWGQVFSAKIPYVQASLTLDLPLSSDARHSAAEIARLKRRGLAVKLQEARNKAAVAVREAYFQVLTTLERVRVVKVREQLAEQNLAAAEKKFKSGLFGSYDVLRVQLDLAQARGAVAKAVRDQVLARTSLETATGDLPTQLRLRMK